MTNIEPSEMQYQQEDQSWVEYLKPSPPYFSVLSQDFDELTKSSDEEVKAFIREAQDTDPTVRSQVAQKLGQSGKDFAVIILAKLLLRDQDPNVRLRASEALGDLASSGFVVN